MSDGNKLTPEEMEHYMDEYYDILDILSKPIKLDGSDKYYYLLEEMELFYKKGNRSAGIRVRKIMQKIRGKAKNIRDNVQNVNLGMK